MIKTVMMMMMIVMLGIVVGMEGKKLSPSECKENGFSAELLCQSCKELSDFVEGDEGKQIVAKCKDCCWEDSMDSSSIGHFPKARLEYCKCNINSYPTVNEFIQKKKSRFPTLSVVEVWGVKPTLHFLNDKGIIQRSMAISLWKTEHIEDFLNKSLNEKDVKKE